MKTMAMGSFFVLLAIIAGIASSPAFADHMTASVSIQPGSSVPGCEKTSTCFDPSDVTVDVGGEVTWSNDDTAAHTVTAGTAADGPSGVFDSSLFMAGTTFSHKFDAEGEFPYFCMVHPWMSGMVTVQAAGMEDQHEEGMTNEINMEGPASATGMLSDGTKVSVWTTQPTAGKPMQIEIEFAGAKHVNHDIMVTQNGKEVLNEAGAHHHEGVGTFETAPLDSSDPVDITDTFQGYGIDDPKTGPIGEVVKFSKVVPEFGTVAMMILAVSIISIVAVTAKTKVIPKL